jgi:enamine deaminase RidA (YjgF/YER057c/UK114 family)
MTPLPSERLRALGLELPAAPEPRGSYRPVVLDGRHAYVSGQLAMEGGVLVAPGKVDAQVPIAEARRAARLATLQGLAAVAAVSGGIDRIHRPIRVGVFVAASEGFDRHPEVGDGATELLIELFGAEGRPARATVGVASLPKNASVEVELLLELA